MTACDLIKHLADIVKIEGDCDIHLLYGNSTNLLRSVRMGRHSTVIILDLEHEDE